MGRRDTGHGRDMELLSAADAESLPPKTAADLKRLRDTLRRNFIFAHLQDEQLEELSASMSPREPLPGAIIVRQGDEGHEFFVVEAGAFDVYVSPGSADAAATGGGESKDGDAAHLPLFAA